MILRTGGRMLVFCDYLCIPQAHAGHASLPAFEQQIVLKVMEYMPHLSFDADAVIHICSADQESPEGHKATEDGARPGRWGCHRVLRQIGDVVQVQDTLRPRGLDVWFDQVVAINGHVITSMEDLPEEVRTGKPGACSSVCQTVFPSLASYFWHPTALMTRAPFGYRIRVPTDQQGHIYFSHFISMVKVAMMEEASAQEVIFANDPQVKVDILRGGSRLRRATQEGARPRLDGAGPSEGLSSLLRLEQAGDSSEHMELKRLRIFKGILKTSQQPDLGLDALASELQNFTQELEKKTFLPDYDMVSHLMQLFVEEMFEFRTGIPDLELAIGVSLPLWRAVREDNLEDCRLLLQDQADPKLADGKGTTALHIAAEARSMEVLKLLLEQGASSTAKDHRGRTPAHCLPLKVDPKTSELIEEHASLHVKNKAGVSVFERFYLWSLSALDGDPFEPLCSRTHFLPGLPELWHLGVQSLGSACPRSLDSVMDQTRRLNINGISRVVHVLVPTHIQRDAWCCDVARAIEPALKMLAYEQGCEIFCIGCEAVLPSLLEEDTDEPEHEGEAFYNDLFHVIDVLPLTYRFYVLDSSYGLALPVLWKLWDRLSGVLTINPSWIFNNNMPNDILQHCRGRAEMLSDLARHRDVKKLSKMTLGCNTLLTFSSLDKSWLCDFSIAPSLAKAYFSDPHSDDAMHRQYEAALNGASDAFWCLGRPALAVTVEEEDGRATTYMDCEEPGFDPFWNEDLNATQSEKQIQRKLTQVLKQLPPWQPPRSIYVILACGSHSPLAAVQNAAYNLQELLPGSMQVYLPHCSWLWHIEGTKPVIETNELLGFLREDGTATASLTSMLVRKRRDLESGRTSPTRRVSKVGFQLEDRGPAKELLGLLVSAPVPLQSLQSRSQTNYKQDFQQFFPRQNFRAGGMLRLHWVAEVEQKFLCTRDDGKNLASNVHVHLGKVGAVEGASIRVAQVTGKPEEKEDPQGQGTSRIPQPFQGEELPPVRRTALELMKSLGCPGMTANFLQLLNEFTNTLCLGHVGNDAELAAVGLGNMMQNCFGLSIAFGITTALDTLVSQAHGIHYLQRSRVIGTLQLVWMFPILWFSNDLLIAVGQHPDVAKHACNYNRVAAFGLNTLAFLRNKNRPNAAAWISGVTSVLHIVWAVLFIVVFNMGNSGAGAANLTTWTLQCLLGAVFLAWNASSLHGSVWQLLGVQQEGFRQWRSYLAIGIPGTLQLCGEWWFWEICALVIGFLGPTPLAAHVATINLVALLFMPSVALSNAAATVVGNSIGELRPKKSRQAAWVAAGMDVIMWTVLALILVTLGKFVVKLLTSNEAVQDITVVLINIYCVAGYFDNVQNVIGGALRGVGINQAPAAVYLICYYLIMLPVGCCFVWTLGSKTLTI
eukprot:s845_g5.t1